jgi:hypothetical protein
MAGAIMSALKFRAIGYALSLAAAVLASVALSGAHACTSPQASAEDGSTDPPDVVVDDATITAELYIDQVRIDLTEDPGPELQAALLSLLATLPESATLAEARNAIRSVDVQATVTGQLTASVHSVPITAEVRVDSATGASICLRVPPLQAVCHEEGW